MARKNLKRAGGAKHWVQLEHYLLDCLAWRTLSANAKIAYIELKRRYNGRNNGMISLSSREAGNAIGSSHHTGARALLELTEHGFIEIAEESDFNRKVHIARTYLLTEKRDDRPGHSAIPTKAFMRWLPMTGAKARSQSRRRDTAVAPVRHMPEPFVTAANVSRISATDPPILPSGQSHGGDTYRSSTNQQERSDNSSARASAPSRLTDPTVAAALPPISPSLAAILKRSA